MIGKRQRSSSDLGAEMAAPSTRVQLLMEQRSQRWLKSIGEACEGMEEAFFCGGSETCTQPVRIVYKGRNAQKMGKVLELPAQGEDKAALEDLMAACVDADYGNPNGNPAERLLDPEYRKALRLDPDDFGLTLNLAEMDILGQVKTQLAPNAAELRAKHYKLNVYEAGDFFRTHVDTLHSKYMVGSLLIVLPSIHEGGQLTVRHAERHHVFNWSLQALPKEPVVQWAAFYSDCKHEVAEVNSGVRITAVYSLTAIPTSAPYLKALSPSSMELYSIMKQALADPMFQDRGEILRFACQHLYPHEKDSTFSMADDPLQLKGADRCLVAMAHSLGLDVDVRLRAEVDEHWDDKSNEIMDISQAYMTDGKQSLGVPKFPLLEYIDLTILIAVPPAWQRQSFYDYT